MDKPPCTVEGCDLVSGSLGLCEKHYYRLYRHGDPLVTRYARGDLGARLAAVLVPGEAPPGRPDLGRCLIFTNKLTAAGYGRMKIAGRMVLLHRYLFEQRHGPVPVGMHLDHLCRNRACARTEHLQVVTPRENTMRGATIAAAYLARGECKNGHAFTAENTRIYRNARICRACSDAAVARYRARKAA
jgi:hypothetical protein